VRTRPAAALALLLASYALLAVAWVMGTPPGSAPDEGDHYMRALAVASGDLYGRPNPELEGQPHALPKHAGPDALASLWLKKGARLVSVPPGLAPVGWGCNAFDPRRDASCLVGHRPPGTETVRLTTMGTVEPGLYLLPGLAARAADRPEAALRLGRAAAAALNVALLAVAAVVLLAGGAGPLPMAGLAVAVTPMVLFVGSTLSTSGTEVAAGICFFAAILAITREEGGRWTWAAAGVAGALLGASRSMGPVWILVMVALVVAWRGWRRCWQAVRRGGGRAVAAASTVALACAATAVWEATAQPGVDFEGDYFWEMVPETMSTLDHVLGDLVGTFGWLDTTMPQAAYLTWAAMVIALVVVAFVRGDRRDRLVLSAVPVILLVLTVGISAGVLRQNGFSVQGRHVLAFAVVLPLLAAEVAAANRRGHDARRHDRWLLVGLVVPAMVVHAVGWYANARRAAVGASGPVWFLGLSKWSPPGTWVPWCLAVVAATITGAIGAFLASGWDRGGDGDAVYPSPREGG